MISAFQLDEAYQQKSMTKSTPFGEAPIKNREEFEKFIVTKFMEQFRKCKQWRSNYYDSIWENCDKAYYGIKKKLKSEDPDEIRSNLRIWYAYKAVESSTSKIVPALLNFDPPCSVFPNEDNSELKELKAKAIQKRLKYNFFQKQNALSLVYKWVKQGERLGLSPLKLFWSFKTKSKIVRRPVYNEQGDLVGIMKVKTDDEYIVEDQPKNAFVNVRRFWWNPDAVDPDEDLRYVFEVFYRPLSYVQNSPLYFNTKELKGIKNPNTMNHSFIQKWDTVEPMVEIIERWDKDTLICVAEGKLIRYRDNPFDDGIIPYYFYRSVVLDDYFVGMGCIEPNLDTEQLANTIINQRIDNLNRIIHKMIFVGATSGFKGKRIRFRPGGVEKLIDINQVKEFQLSDVTPSAYIEQQQAEKLMDAVNGDPEIARGEPTQRRTTATEASIRMAGASYRLDIKVQFAQYEMARIFRDMYRLEKQFGNKQRVIDIFGDDGQLYSFTHDELFTEEYEFDYSLGGYLGNRIIDFQQFIQGLSIIQNTPIMEQFDERELAKIFLERANIRGAERFLKKPMILREGYYRDPYEENRKMLLFQEEIEVLPGELHSKHLPIHFKLLDVPDLPPAVRERVLRHVYKHILLSLEDSRVLGSIGGQLSGIRELLKNIPIQQEGTEFQQQAYNEAAGMAGITMGGANVGQARTTL